MLEALSKIIINGVSEVSLIPESVIMEETIDCGSMSYSDPATAAFFLVSEPQPDEPEAMEASSLELIVCRLATTFGLAAIRLVGAGFGPVLLTRLKSSSDGNWLILEEGLNGGRRRN
jgi:hypothetical protein